MANSNSKRSIGMFHRSQVPPHPPLSVHCSNKALLCFCPLDVNHEERLSSCLAIVDRYVASNLRPAVGLDRMSMHVFSSFYDIANDTGLFNDQDGSSSMTKITIRVLKQTVKMICRGSTRSLSRQSRCKTRS